MWEWVVAFAVILLAIIVISYPRITLARKVSLEGIEDPEAVKAYNRISQMPQFAFIRRMFVNELKKYNPTGTIVDVGCGPGYLISAIARKIPRAHIVGVEISEEMLLTASKNLSSLGFGEKVEFRKGESQSLPIENASVDNVVSTLSLHHWSDPKRAFQEIHRVLRPGGQFLVLDMRRDPRRFFYWLVILVTRVIPVFLGTQALKRINEPLGSVLASYTPSELIQIISEAQFASTSLKGGVGWFFLWGQK